MSLLPSSPDISSDGDPRVVGVDSEDADDLLAALGSETARSIVATLHEEPASPAKLADRVDTSVQNVQYHLTRLEDAGVVTVAGTAYSEKGREMDVYAPADSPLVIVAAEEERTSGVRAALSRLLGSIGVLLVGSLAVQQYLGGGLFPGGESASGGTDGGGGAAGDTAPTETATPTDDGGGFSIAEATQTPQETAAETAQAATEAAASGGDALFGSLPPGLVFFLGGLLVLCTAVLLSYTQRAV
ncbi:helix-turn-helix domain-containing protein [Halosegnis rubeus]|uniref:Helix-turn-helix domain-containing protein n=1 Tax=Halosegnis rubeus TaxID=2212850 RepID=A0A5N5UML2_9EURY|nr:winged helix-turn-helix domain-containing protein [Halosegnis rubeus]KAB7516086.1 helix-turn-helix domain-containing protein [Halosegnis rubeus]KAB7520169.1 helix-turn-helix domain-containing protein [Halosegnis rubeus]